MLEKSKNVYNIMRSTKVQVQEVSCRIYFYPSMSCCLKAKLPHD